MALKSCTVGLVSTEFSTTFLKKDKRKLEHFNQVSA